MSFFSDLFEGNWGNLGTDITHAPSSFANHPEEWAEVAGAGALIAAPFLIPEIGAGLAGAFGASDLCALAGGELAGAEFAGALRAAPTSADGLQRRMRRLAAARPIHWRYRLPRPPQLPRRQRSQGRQNPG